jgi:hypothetical protein
MKQFVIKNPLFTVFCVVFFEGDYNYILGVITHFFNKQKPNGKKRQGLQTISRISQYYFQKTVVNIIQKNSQGRKTQKAMLSSFDGQNMGIHYECDFHKLLH